MMQLDCVMQWFVHLVVLRQCYFDEKSDFGCFLKCQNQCCGFDVKLWGSLEHKRSFDQFWSWQQCTLGLQEVLTRWWLCVSGVSQISHGSMVNTVVASLSFPCLMCDAFLILFLAKQMPACAWACLSVSHSPNGCSPRGIIAKVSTLTYTNIWCISQTCTHFQVLWSGAPGPPHPSLPVGEVEQQGAQRQWRLQERKADQRGNSFTGAKCNVVKWDQPAYLTNPTFHSSSVTRSLIHSVTHLLALRSLTCSLNSNTNKQFSKSRWFSEGDPVCKTKLTWVGYKCINQSFDDIEQLAKVEGCKHHPSGISALPVRSIYEHIRWS